MAKTARSKSANQLIRFRLAVAVEILGNLSDTFDAKTDIHGDPHILELLDEYAIRLLIEWFCTKLGCSIYAKDGQSSNQGLDSSVARIFQDLLAYPFLNTREELISKELRHRCDQLLTGSFEPTIELAGALYEQVCNRPLKFLENRQLGVSDDIQESDRRRPVGQFYTPPNIVRYCFDRLQEADLNKFISETQLLPQSAPAAPLPSTEQVCRANWKLLDPACGTGNFLVGAVRFAAAHITNKYALTEFCKTALFGIELDGKAASIARICVALETAAQTNNQTIDIESLKDSMINLQKNIVVSDSVMQTLVPAAKSIDLSSTLQQSRNWLSDRTAVDNSFDLVITNPPYVSFGSRGQPDLLASQRTLFKNSFPEGAEYKVRLHSIFQDLALRLCRPGGKVILFVPDAFLTGSYYGRLRKLILQLARITSLSELPESTVPGAVVGRWCVAQYEKKQKRNDEKNSDLRPSAKTNSIFHSNRTNKSDHSGDDEVDYTVLLHSTCEEPAAEYSAKLSSLLHSDRSKIRLLFNDLDEKIFIAISAHSPLRSRVLGHTGIRSRHGQNKIISTQLGGPHVRRGIKSGAQVTAFTTAWDGTWINVDPQLLFAGGFDREVIERPKVLLRQTGDRLIAAVDESGLYHLNNVHSFSSSKLRKNENSDGKNIRNAFGKHHNGNDGEGQSRRFAMGQGSESNDPYYICALMNSALWLYIYQMTTRERSRALAQIDIETVESLPVPEFDALIERTIAGLSLQLHKNYSAEISRGIDRLVYDIYGLQNSHVDHIESYYTKVQWCKGSNTLRLPTTDEAMRMLIEEPQIVQTMETR